MKIKAQTLPWYLLPLAGALIVIGLPFLGASGFVILQVQLIAVMSMLVSSLNLSLGYAGELALGQVAVYATGAYVAGYLGTRGDTDMVLQLLAGGGSALVVGLLVGIPGLRFGGWALAMSSFFLVLIIPDIVTLSGNTIGGFAGLSGIPLATLFGYQLSIRTTYVAIVVVAALWFVFFRNAVTSRFGNGLLVMRHSGVLASSAGISVYRLKLVTYAVAAVAAGLAGVLFTQVEGFIAPSTFDFSLAISILAASIMGGQRSVYGAVFGAALLTLAPVEFASFSQYSTIIYGVFLLAFGVLLSQGLAGIIRPYLHRWVPGSRPAVVPVTGGAPPLDVRGGEVLEVTSVSMSFGGITALDGVSLTARPGEITALIGPNGSGKTTLLNAVSGFCRPGGGTISIGGRQVSGLPPHRLARLGVARTFQTPSVPPALTTAEVVASGRLARERPALLPAVLRTPGYWRARREDARQAAAVLGALGLRRFAGQEAASLPLGTRRLVEVGRALAAGARVLLLDEVASGLDEEELDNLASILRTIRAAGLTVVLVEHNFDLVLRLADVIHVLAQGKLVISGAPAEIQSDAEVGRIYLGTTLLFNHCNISGSARTGSARTVPMRDVVICSPLRTPVGRYGGVLKDLSAAELGATVARALLDRTGLPPEAVDDVVLGQCYPDGEAPALGRVVALDAGLPVTTPGYQLDRRCGSGLQAVINAAMTVATGGADLILAGGAESMSQVEYAAKGLRFGGAGAVVELNDRLARARVTAGGTRYPVPGGMLETAENVRAKYGIVREEQDELALASHQRAVAAQDSGAFAEEIVPVIVLPPQRGGTAEISTDEHPRRDTSMERLARLRPVRLREDPGATVTAGNSSGQNDGAAICVVTTRDRAYELGLDPLGRLVSWAVAGVEPGLMGLGPVPATATALRRADLSLDDMDLIELNEAFAAQVLGCTREWGFTPADFGRLNVNGSGISLGHPVGATGCRILTTMLRELRRRQARYALETMCIGGGQGLAAVFERVS
jgi:acetyl-CoA acetyltransferase family protein